MRYHVLLILLYGLISASFAQDPGQPPTEFQDPGDAAVSTDPGDVRDDVQAFLASKGWTEGINRGGGRDFFLAVGVATIPVQAGSRDFNSARINAFGRAMLNAKQELTEYHGVEIRTAASLAYQEGLMPEERDAANQAPSLLDKAKRLAHAKLDALLREDGLVRPEEASKEDIQEVLTSETYRSLTETLAQSTIAGLQAFKVFESKADGHHCQVAVLAIQSELLGQMAASLNGHRINLPTRTPKRPIGEQIPTDPEAILTTMGVQQRVDENGELVVLAYGQAAPRTASDRSVEMAYSKARQQALGLLRSFAGENAYVSSVLLNAETSEEFADGASSYQNEEAYRLNISTQADALKIAGIATVKRWRAVHPLGDGTPTVGVVVGWSPGMAALAEESLDDAMEAGAHSSSGAAADDDGF